MKSNLNDIFAEEFQIVVDQFLDRNRSILDLLTKYQTANTRLSRAIVKSATQCGCIKISGDKKPSPSAQIEGVLCDRCRHKIEQELGETLFYISAIASTFDISLYDCMLEEKKRLNLLGSFSLK